MKILPLALALIASPALAQQVSTPKLRKSHPVPVAPIVKKAQAEAAPTPTPAATPEKPARRGRPARVLREVKPKQEQAASAQAPAQASASGKPKKRGGMFGFFGRLFGGGKKSAAAPGATVEATSAGASTPRATARRPAPGAVADSGSVTRPNLRQPKGENSVIRPAVSTATEKSTDRVTVPAPAPTGDTRRSATRPALVPPAPESASGETSTIKPSVKRVSKAETTSAILPASPKRSTSSSSSLPGGTATSSGEFDKARYQTVRREAAADPAIASLGEKLNGTSPGPAYKQAARAYSAALFARMREIDPSQKGWFDRMESATIRRIESGKTLVAE